MRLTRGHGDLSLTGEGRQHMVSTNADLEVEHSGLEVGKSKQTVEVEVDPPLRSNFPSQTCTGPELSEGASKRPGGQTECEGGFQ
jgi:hypothetical protein